MHTDVSAGSALGLDAEVRARLSGSDSDSDGILTRTAILLVPTFEGTVRR
jgi:hypothetical protein